MSVLKEIHRNRFAFHYGEDNPSGRTYAKHCHFLYEAYYLIEGAIDYIVAGVTYSLKSGSLLLIPPCVFHQAAPTSAGGPYRRAVMLFAPPEGMGGERPLLYRGSPEIDALFGRLIAYADMLTDDELDVIVAAYPAELMILLAHAAPSATPRAALPGTPEPVRRAIAFVNDRLTEPFTLDDVAAAAGVSKPYLCHAFVKNVGEGVMEYARHRRLEEARLMIGAGIRPGKAADMYGFDNYTTFYRAYRKLYGTAPRPRIPAVDGSGETAGRAL